MAYVNLWELITDIGRSKDASNKEKCQAIQCMQGPRFGSELSLEINEQGVWTVSVFDHNDTSQYVHLTINPNGYVKVTRGRSNEDVYEERTVSF